uniref:Hexosyltransferase n=1 Tax=Schmidtea mediterranea TaxID=79327 RepID=I1ZIJ3_SCHMD|nr:beta 1,3 galactosyltransferase-1 [Schmidtea mediterranea]
MRFTKHNLICFLSLITMVMLTFQFFKAYQMTYKYPQLNTKIVFQKAHNHNTNHSNPLENPLKIHNLSTIKTTTVNRLTEKLSSTGKSYQFPNVSLDFSMACRGSIFLYIVVISEKKNEKLREKIRQSWASVKIINQKLVSSVFLLTQNSHTVETTDDQSLLNESKKYHDVFLSPFTKTERENLYLYMDALKLANQCQTSEFSMMITDDMFPNIPVIIQQLSANVSLMCNLVLSNPVVRNTKSIYYVSKSDYSENIYPPHCKNNSPFIISNLLVSNIIKTFNKTKLWFYDAYLLGVLPHSLNVTPVEFPKSISIIEMRPHFVYVNRRNYGILTNGGLLPGRIWKKLMIQMILK